MATNPGEDNASQQRASGSTALNRQSASRNATRSTSKSLGNRKSQYARLSKYNPATAGANATTGIGLLEAEFLGALGLLILLMFSSDATQADKIMSTMKRGTLICAIFFILAMVASIGSGATKFAKAFGALIIVTILVTSPVSTVITDIDNIIKNDWTGTDETGNDTSADSGTSSSTVSPTSANPIGKIAGIIAGFENSLYRSLGI